jgi:hypothetical protein
MVVLVFSRPGELVFFELLDDVVFSYQRVAYAIFFEEPQRHAAARAAVTDGVKLMLPFDDGVYQASFMALLQHVFSFLLGYLPVVLGPAFHEYVPAEADDYLCVYGVIAVFKHFPAGAGAQCQAIRVVYDITGLGEGEQVGVADVFTVRIGDLADEPADQGYFGPLRLENVVAERESAVARVELHCMVHFLDNGIIQ